MLAERWRVHYNTLRPHSSLGYRPSAPEAWLSANNHPRRGERHIRRLSELRDKRYTSNPADPKDRSDHMQFAFDIFSSLSNGLNLAQTLQIQATLGQRVVVINWNSDSDSPADRRGGSASRCPSPQHKATWLRQFRMGSRKRFSGPRNWILGSPLTFLRHGILR